MNPDPLEQLRDIHTAADAPWWPPAPGWWMLFFLLLLGLILLGRHLLARHRVRQRRRQMLGWIDNLNGELDPAEQPQAYLSGMNRVFKAVALTAFPAENCAALSGNEWVAFLQTRLDGQTEALQALASGPFDPKPEFDAAAISELGRNWINRYG